MVIQNGCPTAYSERIGLKILNEEKSVGFQFDAFNWKNGGQESDVNFSPDGIRMKWPSERRTPLCHMIYIRENVNI